MELSSCIVIDGVMTVLFAIITQNLCAAVNEESIVFSRVLSALTGLAVSLSHAGHMCSNIAVVLLKRLESYDMRKARANDILITNQSRVAVRLSDCQFSCSCLFHTQGWLLRRR